MTKGSSHLAKTFKGPQFPVLFNCFFKNRINSSLRLYLKSPNARLFNRINFQETLYNPLKYILEYYYYIQYIILKNPQKVIE